MNSATPKVTPAVSAVGGSDVDYVNHPPHYTQSDAKCPNCMRPIECIDVVRHRDFSTGNAIKYLWRYKDKNGVQDLQKAVWYINDLIEKLTEKV